MAAPSEVQPSRDLTPESPDVALVCAARAGDRRACFVIWSRYAGMVQRLVRRFLGPGPDDQDVCQEAFLRVFRRLRELHDPSTLQGFVVSVTLGVAKNELRRRRIRSIVGLLPEESLVQASGSAGQSEAREAMRALYQVLDTLNAEDRSLFITRFAEKMELTEVAAVHGMSLSTVKRRLARVGERVSARVQSNPVLRDYVGDLVRGGSL